MVRNHGQGNRGVGQVEIWRGNALVHLEPREEKALIALAINRCGIEPGVLAEAIWPEEKARRRHERSLPPLITSLRKKLRDALGAEVDIDDARRSGVYRLNAPDDLVYYWRFQEGVSLARQLMDERLVDDAIYRYEDARREWRGTPLILSRGEAGHYLIDERARLEGEYGKFLQE